jgi:hypothetical protein
MVSAGDGVNVATFVVVLYVVVPATVPPGFVTTNVVPVTAWLKPTETVVLTAMPFAPEAGLCDVTVGAAAVVKVHVTGVMAALPDAVAPDTVTVYVVPGASAAPGVNVASVPGPLSATVPVTDVLPATTEITVEPFATARSKPTVTVEPSATLVAPVAGVWVVADGAGASVVNDHDTTFIVAPAAFVAPDAVTVYVTPELNGAAGVNVAVFVVALYAVEPATAPPGPVTASVAPVTA